jgi:hypothetical protein
MSSKVTRDEARELITRLLQSDINAWPAKRLLIYIEQLERTALPPTVTPQSSVVSCWCSDRMPCPPGKCPNAPLAGITLTRKDALLARWCALTVSKGFQAMHDGQGAAHELVKTIDQLLLDPPKATT